MQHIKHDYTLALAQSESDIRAAQRLRYDVFVRELGADGPMVDHDAGLEIDHYDPFCEHLILRHKDVPVGVYRLMRRDHAQAAGRFYCEDEYDLTPLLESGRNLLELGRSCLAPDHRGGIAMHLIWQALADYVAAHEIDVLFGVASFHGTDLNALAEPLSLLHAQFLAEPELRPRSRRYSALDLMPVEDIDRRAAMLAMPALLKGYLRLGGKIGDGAYVDEDFNCTDVFLVMDTAKLNESAAQRLRR